MEPDGAGGNPLRGLSGLLSDGGAAGPQAARRRRARPAGGRRPHRREVGHLRCRKKPSERTHFSEIHGSVAAYGVFAHRHGAEIEQELARAVTFVPHLVPLDRGILETIYTRVRPDTTADEVGAAFEAAYGDRPFVRLCADRLPEIKHVAHTNFCDIGWRVDAGRVVLVACLDNLGKGAAGQALQCFNVAFGFDERAGLIP